MGAMYAAQPFTGLHFDFTVQERGGICKKLGQGYIHTRHQLGCARPALCESIDHPRIEFGSLLALESDVHRQEVG